MEATNPPSMEVTPDAIHLNDLSDELLSLVLAEAAATRGALNMRHAHLGQLPEVAAAALTCRRLAALVASDHADAIWRAVVCRALALPPSVEAEGSGWRALCRSLVALPAAERKGMPPLGLVAHPKARLHIKEGPSPVVESHGRPGADQAARSDAPLTQRRHPALRWRAVLGAAPRPKIVASEVAYFEASIEEDPSRAPPEETHDRESCVSIGLCTADFPLKGKQPGWDVESVGWHGDDGCVFHGHGMGLRQFGGRFGSGDVVGCGVHAGYIFFTRNGEWAGCAFRAPVNHLLPSGRAAQATNPGTMLHAVVGVDTATDRVRLNFGRTPFAFDPDSAPAHLAEEFGRRLADDAPARLAPMTTFEVTEQQIAIAAAAREGRLDGPKTVPPAFHQAGRGMPFDPAGDDEESGEEELGEEDSWSEGDDDEASEYSDDEAMTYEQQQAWLQHLADNGMVE